MNAKKVAADFKVLLQAQNDPSTMKSLMIEALAHQSGIEVNQVTAAQIELGFKKFRLIPIDGAVTMADFEGFRALTNPRSDEGKAAWVNLGNLNSGSIFAQVLDPTSTKTERQKQAQEAYGDRRQAGAVGVTVINLEGKPVENVAVNFPIPGNVTTVEGLHAAIRENPYLHVVVLERGDFKPVQNFRTGEIFPKAVLEVITDRVAVVSGGLQPRPRMSAADTIVTADEISALEEADALEQKVAAKAKALNGIRNSAVMGKVLTALDEIDKQNVEDAVVTDDILRKFGIDQAAFAQTSVGKAQAERMVGA